MKLRYDFGNLDMISMIDENIKLGKQKHRNENNDVDILKESEFID